MKYRNEGKASKKKAHAPRPGKGKRHVKFQELLVVVCDFNEEVGSKDDSSASRLSLGAHGSTIHCERTYGKERKFRGADDVFPFCPVAHEPFKMFKRKFSSNRGWDGTCGSRRGVCETQGANEVMVT